MTEREFMDMAVKAGHKAADRLKEISDDFDEMTFLLQSALHITYLSDLIFDNEEEEDE